VLPYSACGTRPTIFFETKRVKTKDGSEDSIVLQIQTLVRVPEFYRIPEVYRIPVFYVFVYLARSFHHHYGVIFSYFMKIYDNLP
jgi:hypothetical protein